MTKRKKKLHGTVEKVIKPTYQGAPEKAQIGINEADHLYREVRVENIFTDEAGDEASLKPGAKVDIVVEADSDDMKKKSD